MPHAWWVMVHMNESWHIWMSHVTHICRWDNAWRWMSHVARVTCLTHDESCLTYEWVCHHIWISHVSYEWVMSRMNESCHIWMSHALRIYKSHGTHIPHIRVRNSTPIAHTWMSHGTYEWVMLHESRFTHGNESRPTHMHEHGTQEWVMAHMKESWHIRMSHGTCEWVIAHMNESWHMYILQRQCLEVIDPAPGHVLTLEVLQGEHISLKKKT